MPMYFPDLKSVAQLATNMSKHKGDKKYMGIHPVTEKELPQARKELAKYLREAWDDDVFAVEVESAATEENYQKIMEEHVMKKMMGLQEKEPTYLQTPEQYLCPDFCNQLSITETEQNKLKENVKPSHMCKKYNVQVAHHDAHPRIYKCTECMESK